MAEAALCQVAERILTLLAPEAFHEIGSWREVNDELEKLRRRVSLIQAVLADAEERSSESHQIREWLALLKEAFYEAEDLLDEISTDVLRRQVMTGTEMAKKVHLFFSSSNQLVYSSNLTHKIKKIRKRLDEIEGYGRNFHLVERTMERLVGKHREQTHSRVPEIVVGRHADKKTIIELLLSSNILEDVETIPLVGIGGLGKTTLAQIVFNDENVKAQFELRLWVCVGDNFDVKLIVQKILGSLTHEKQGDLDMDPLVDLLHERINGKKYLIVLDDVWNEDPHKWFKLKDLLVGGARGSKVILTTRHKRIAHMTCPTKVHEMEGLDDSDSWLLFKHLAFQRCQVPSENYEKIGKEIVAKCKGVPLAIKAIGRLLFSKNSEFEWLSFKDKELSEIDQQESNSIIQILKLSYDHLPSHLKHCFAYCCLFPKDHIIHVPTLKNLWMAQGFVKPSDPLQCLEDTCHQYFMDLLWRSFFQEVQKDDWGNIETCKMHGLMHDLATEVAGKEIVVSNSNGEFINRKTRHVSFRFDDLPSSSWRVPPSLFENSNVRTFLLLHESEGEFQSSCKIEKRQLDVIFSNLRRLRVLDLHNSSIDKMPDSLNKLKYLRHLDLSDNNDIKVLPDSIITLQNLQVLILDGCYKLQQLPKDIKKLINLSQLGLSKCYYLSHMPGGLGQLTCLHTLSRFVVGRDSSMSKFTAALDELGGLNNLRGELEIGNLGCSKNATSQSQCRAANLKEKQHLQRLSLHWHTDNLCPVGDDEMALEVMEPHQNLKGIKVTGYRGLKFPRWVSFLSNLVEISLLHCTNCWYLPPLHQLPCLRQLSISSLMALEYIDNEETNWDDARVSFFPSLEILRLEFCNNLKGWWKTTPPTSSSSLPRFHLLSELKIYDCPNMTLMPLFPPLKTLYFAGGSVNSLEEILNSTTTSSSSFSSTLSIALSQLQVLYIDLINDIEFLPEGLVRNLISLKTLSLGFCTRLNTICQAMQHLTSLEEVSITDCAHLYMDDDQKMQWQALQTLRSLKFHGLPQLESLPMWTQHASALQELQIWHCIHLMSLPDWMPKLTSLQKLIICFCPQLKKRCESKNGEDWPKIAHIPNIKVEDKVVQRNGH